MKPSWVIFFAYIGLFACLGVMRIDNINAKAQISSLENNLIDTSIYNAKLANRQIAIVRAFEALSEQSNHHGVDIAKLTLTRTSTIEEVERVIAEAIEADNAEEEEYNSLVASTIINIEENMQLMGQLQQIEREIIKKQVLKELQESKE